MINWDYKSDIDLLKPCVMYFSWDDVFPGGHGSTKRAGYQALALLITLAISIVSGAITGQCLLFPRYVKLYCIMYACNTVSL